MSNTTGVAPLPDIGTLAYNGITFSSLYHSEIHGQIIQDDAQRTTKYVEYTLNVEGQVTLEAGQATTDATWQALRAQLSVHGGTLTYKGKGFGPFVVNAPGPRGDIAGSGLNDVAWGPVPKIIHFQPLGASRSANITWQCVTRVPEVKQFLATPVLQFNWGATLTYDEDGYSGMVIAGTLEIPLTRTSADSRKVQDIVDSYRQRWLNIRFDLTQYRVVRRSFNYSRDKRKCEWEFAIEQLPPMGLPPGAVNAHGTMSVRKGMVAGGKTIPIIPSGKTAFGWTISLRATYTVRSDEDQRLAAVMFYSLLWFRMWSSVRGNIPPLTPDNPKQQLDQRKQPADGELRAGVLPPEIGGGGVAAALGKSKITNVWDTIFRNARAPANQLATSTLLTDFGFDEGLYLDSKTISFHASWYLVTSLSCILQASGVWRWLENTAGGSAWAGTMFDIMGWRSVLVNELDKNFDLIVDFGGGDTPNK